MRHAVRNVGNILKGISERTNDETIVICERPFDEIKSNRSSVKDDVSRNGRSRSIDHSCLKSSRNEAEDVSSGFEGLAGLAISCRCTTVEGREVQLLPNIRNIA